jgi:hypothetical protein
MTERRDPRQAQSERLRDAVERKSEEARTRATEQSIESPARQPEQGSVRAKSSGHRKKTADKWNQ